jgi:hypothetical protein
MGADRGTMLIVHFRKTFRVRACEWLLATMVFLWGVVLLQPADTFAISPSYSELQRWASEATWGWFCLVGGGLRLTALAINGAARPSPHARAVLAALSAFFFAQITLGLLLSGGPLSTGLAVYPLAAAFDIYNAMRAADDAAHSDRKARDAGASA